MSRLIQLIISYHIISYCSRC